MCVLDGSVFTRLVASVLETACDAVKKFVVGADAVDLELLASSNFSSSRIFGDTILLYEPC